MGKTDSSEKRRWQEARVQRAAQEAAKLREVEGLRSGGKNREEACRLAGYVKPHSSYYRRLARFKQGGEAALVDRRHPAASKVTPEIRGFVAGVARATPDLKTEELARQLEQQYGVKLALRTVRDILQTAGLSRPVVRMNGSSPKAASAAKVVSGAMQSLLSDPTAQVTELQGAGLSLVAFMSERSGYGVAMAETIQREVAKLKAPAVELPIDRAHRDVKGRFLPGYNAPRPRRDPAVGAVFESVSVKRGNKDLRRMKIITASTGNLVRKIHALMALPAVCDQGRFDGVTGPKGEWLASLGGLDFMPETLAKMARELKYAGVSQALMECHAAFWKKVSKEQLGDEACCCILYVDASTKPLWTAHFAASGRVASLGRIMPCMDNVLIHTGAGVPLYLREYSGYAPLVKNLLPVMHELESAIGEGMLGRLTIVDGEMNSVGLFKEFDRDFEGQGRWFVTPLRHDQVGEPEKLFNHLVEYRDGDWISPDASWVYLTDSKDRKAPAYKARAIVLQRRTKQTYTVFASNAPPELFSNKQLLDAFFRRWPAQEHVFRDLNGGLSFKAVHGYGKQLVQNITVIDQLTKLSAQLDSSKNRLQQATSKAAVTLKEVQDLEREHRRQCRLESGARHSQILLRQRGRERTQAYLTRRQDERRAHDAAEKIELRRKLASHEHDKAEARIRSIEKVIERKVREKTVLETRTQHYENDTELDQDLSTFKLGLALVVRLLLTLFFGGLRLQLDTFISELVALSATRVRTASVQLISFRATRRNPLMMEQLDAACARINAVNHVDADGRLVRFEVMWPPGTRRHAT